MNNYSITTRSDRPGYAQVKVYTEETYVVLAEQEFYSEPKHEYDCPAYALAAAWAKAYV